MARILILSFFSGLLFHTKTSLFYHSFIPVGLYIASTSFLAKESSFFSKAKQMASIMLPSIALCAAGIIMPYKAFTGSLLPDLGLLKEISSGYSEGMGWGENNIQLYTAIFVLVIWLASAGILLIRMKNYGNTKAIAMLLPLAFIVLLGFKHGLVRQGHVSRFFVFSVVTLSILIVCDELRSSTQTRNLLRLGFTITSITAYASCFWPVLASRSMTENFFKSLQNFRNPFAIGQYTHQRTKSNMERLHMPDHILKRIGSSTVDIVPRELSLMHANHLNWHPRPTLQSYQGYTEKLDQLNANYLRASGPKYILLHYDSLDTKNQAFYSPLEWIEMICGYSAVSSFQNNYLGLVTLLEKMNQPRCSELTSFKTIYAHINEGVSLPKVPPNALMALSISVKTNLIGKLQATALRGATIGIKLQHNDNRTANALRFAPTNSRNGLLVYPIAFSDGDLNCIFKSPLDCNQDAPDSISVVTQNPHFFDPKITIRMLLIKTK